MAKVIVVGDGPAGLSAALFLAKNGHEAVVYSQDETAMHYAQLFNYLGIPEVNGSDFQRVARDQVAEQDGQLRQEEVSEVRRDGERFAVRAAGAEDDADYLVLAGGKKGQRLADQLGVERTGEGVVIDTEYRTSVERVYAVGRLARPDRSQAIISAGAGATAALDIMAREAGKDVTDWDSPPES